MIQPTLRHANQPPAKLLLVTQNRKPRPFLSIAVQTEDARWENQCDITSDNRYGWKNIYRKKRKLKKIYYIANNLKKIVLYREETEVNLSVSSVWMCMDVNVAISHHLASLYANRLFQFIQCLSVYAKSFAHCVYLILLRFYFLELFFFLQLLDVAHLWFPSVLSNG